VSFRLLDGKSPYFIAKAVGTSLGQIESTYDQIQAELASRQVQQGMDTAHERVTPKKKVSARRTEEKK